MREGARTVGLCILGSVLYGVLHDQITVRICLEYFTEFHPVIVDTDDPTTLALVWGVVATWWVGLILGVAIAACARAGSGPALGWRDLVRPLALLLGTMALFALLAGLVGFRNDSWLAVLGPPIEGVSYRHFNACLFAHNASYNIGFLGGITLCAWAIRKRRRA